MFRMLNPCMLMSLKNMLTCKKAFKAKNCNLSTNFQNIFVKSVSCCRNYCNDSDDKRKKFKVDFNEITNGDPKLMEEVSSILYLIRERGLKGDLMPKNITARDWKYLLTNKINKTQRLDHLRFIALNEIKDMKRKRKKMEKIEEFIEKKNELSLPDHIDYAAFGNSMYRRFLAATRYMRGLDICRFCTASIHSNDIVIDMGYEEFMSDREIIDCVRQIVWAGDANRYHINPLNLHLCNVPKSGTMRDRLINRLEETKKIDYMHIHNERYLDLFERENLVYLSPYAPEVLQEYNPEDVYIIGGFVDKTLPLKISLNKAKENGIRAVQLPLDLYFPWKSHKKSLTIDAVYNIMLDLNYYRNMKKALEKHVPTRFYYKDQNSETINDATEGMYYENNDSNKNR